MHAGAYLSSTPPPKIELGGPHSLPETLSRTYALSRYSSETIIEYNVARFSVFSRSADVVYRRTSSSRFIVVIRIAAHAELRSVWFLVVVLRLYGMRTSSGMS